MHNLIWSAKNLRKSNLDHLKVMLHSVSTELPFNRLQSKLAEHLKVAEQCEQPKKRLAPDAGVGLLADSDRELDAGESQCSLLFDDDE